MLRESYKRVLALLLLIQIQRLSSTGVYGIEADGVDTKDTFSLEDSWENGNLIEENKGKLGLEDKSNNELSALDEQRVMKTRIKRSINGSGSSYLVICDKDFIEVVVERHEVISMDIDNIYLADGLCKASYNETHVFVKTKLNDCGTNYSETEQQMYFSNALTVAAPIAPGSVITRKQSFLFNFRCAYGRLVTVSGFKFTPPKQEVKVKKSNLGNFTVVMGSYADDGFLSSTSEQYPAFKSFEDRIHIEYGVTTRNGDIVVRAETCRATPTSKPIDTPHYEFISEGCDKDTTITHHTHGLSPRHAFSIKVFRFVANHSFVYIHCDIRLCHRNISDSVCARNTTCSNRKRREASSFDATYRTYQLSIGPIMYREKINNENKPADETESSPGSTTIVTLICVALVIVLLFIIVVLLTRKHRGTNRVTSLEANHIQCPAVKMEASAKGSITEQ